MSEHTVNDYLKDMPADMAPGNYSPDGTGFYVSKESADKRREKVEPNRMKHVLQDYVATMSRAYDESYDEHWAALDKRAGDVTETDDEVRNYSELYSLSAKVERGEELDEEDVQYLVAIESYQKALSKSLSIEGEDQATVAEHLGHLRDNEKIGLLINDCIDEFNAADTQAEQQIIERKMSDLEDYKYWLENSTYASIEPHEPNPDNTNPELVVTNNYFAIYYSDLVAKAKATQPAVA